MKKPKWAKILTKADMRHLSQSSENGRPSLRSLKANIDGQNKAGIRCFECEFIFNRLSNAGII